jgi:hypothetical protein
MSIIYVCNVCGKEFKKGVDHDLYCSKKCAAKDKQHPNLPIHINKEEPII